MANPIEYGSRSKAQLTDGEAWTKIFGSFWSTKTAQQELGITKKQLSRLIADHEIFALKTSDHVLIIPELQFMMADGKWQVIPHLPDVLKKFKFYRNSPGGGKDGFVDTWTMGSVLRGERKDLGGKSILDYLKTEEDPTKAIELAEDLATVMEYSVPLWAVREQRRGGNI